MTHQICLEAHLGPRLGQVPAVVKVAHRSIEPEPCLSDNRGSQQAAALNKLDPRPGQAPLVLGIRNSKEARVANHVIEPRLLDNNPGEALLALNIGDSREAPAAHGLGTKLRRPPAAEDPVRPAWRVHGSPSNVRRRQTALRGLQEENQKQSRESKLPSHFYNTSTGKLQRWWEVECAKPKCYLPSQRDAYRAYDEERSGPYAMWSTNGDEKTGLSDVLRALEEQVENDKRSRRIQI
ncbi:hypothetical protein DFH11DRAFT_1743511 [Phellopilus nigrolimitatus]|nr:hypothetical protein DFH11DRAFT_1743511 [Phellopilus nigrolimitatus]